MVQTTPGWYRMHPRIFRAVPPAGPLERRSQLLGCSAKYFWPWGGAGLDRSAVIQGSTWKNVGKTTYVKSSVIHRQRASCWTAHAASASQNDYAFPETTRPPACLSHCDSRGVDRRLCGMGASQCRGICAGSGPDCLRYRCKHHSRCICHDETSTHVEDPCDGHLRRHDSDLNLDVSVFTPSAGGVFECISAGGGRLVGCTAFSLGPPRNRPLSTLLTARHR